MYINHVQLVGNLTRDVELKALPSGIKVANFSIATNRTWKGEDGQKKEAVEYHNVIAFGRTAEVIAQYVFKGHQILVEGRLQTRSWDDKTSGEKKYRTEVIVESFQFGNKPRDGAAPARTEDHSQEQPNTEAEVQLNEPDTNDASQFPADGNDTEDIPF